MLCPFRTSGLLSAMTKHAARRAVYSGCCTTPPWSILNFPRLEDRLQEATLPRTSTAKNRTAHRAAGRERRRITIKQQMFGPVRTVTTARLHCSSNNKDSPAWKSWARTEDGKACLLTLAYVLPRLAPTLYQILLSSTHPKKPTDTPLE